MGDETELTDAEYLRDLAERLRHIPVAHGTDGYDVDRLGWIADKLTAPGEGGVKATVFALEMVGICTRKICGVSPNRTVLEDSLRAAREASRGAQRGSDMDGYHHFEITEHPLGARQTEQGSFPEIEGKEV